MKSMRVNTIVILALVLFACSRLILQDMGKIALSNKDSMPQSLWQDLPGVRQVQNSDLPQGRVFATALESRQVPVVSNSGTGGMHFEAVKKEVLKAVDPMADWDFTGSVEGRSANLEKGGDFLAWRVDQIYQGCKLLSVVKGRLRYQCGSDQFIKDLSSK